ncbi:cupin domain-containing protein [Roseospira goensis]|uniref:Quercetin dioxygenase-like cupin family protein n=1 Tax=Roseospira goensis TaxID=391922 RepID=A0A7W6WJF1_9PROT|nr:cupin domain-containing protein [Roseospira goensis]MBB4284518.1 quercetin dioxygenase-like cupin family protein [Roseospira goensis]
MRDDETSAPPATPGVRPSTAPFRWAGVECRPYKEEGSAPFKAVSRQVLFSEPWLAGELRYFEVEAGGHTTLERHQHAHGVMILRGEALCLLGDAVHRVAPYDLVQIPPMTWHQFRTRGDGPMGFLCMVDAARDRPQLPTQADLDGLRATPAVAAFLEGQDPTGT